MSATVRTSTQLAPKHGSGHRHAIGRATMWHGASSGQHHRRRRSARRSPPGTRATPVRAPRGGAARPGRSRPSDRDRPSLRGVRRPSVGRAGRVGRSRVVAFGGPGRACRLSAAICAGASFRTSPGGRSSSSPAPAQWRSGGGPHNSLHERTSADCPPPCSSSGSVASRPCGCTRCAPRWGSPSIAATRPEPSASRVSGSSTASRPPEDRRAEPR